MRELSLCQLWLDGREECELKLKELPYFLGLQPGPKTYGFKLKSFDLPGRRNRRIRAMAASQRNRERDHAASVDELRKFLSPGDVAIDIGAHTGDSTIPIALAVGKQGCVLALEPNRYVFPVLQKNAELNRGQDQYRSADVCGDARRCGNGIPIFRFRILQWRPFRGDEQMAARACLQVESAGKKPAIVSARRLPAASSRNSLHQNRYGRL